MEVLRSAENPGPGGCGNNTLKPLAAVWFVCLVWFGFGFGLGRFVGLLGLLGLFVRLFHFVSLFVDPPQVPELESKKVGLA